jgi:two-component system, OmpR family, phosphate regulon sensor histidine kinase PhoR
MRNPLKKITLVFILIALLPVALVIYELDLLNKNEAIIRETYENQLDAILYSVNQYSDDIISSWANRIRLEANESSHDSLSYVERLKTVVNQTDVVRYVYFSDLKSNSTLYALSEEDESTDVIKSVMDGIVRAEQARIEKLVEYEEAGFRKMEAIDVAVEDNGMPILFVLDENPQNYKIGGIILDLPSFIQNTVGPKMQGISQDKFVISAFSVKNDSLIYSTDFQNQPSTDEAMTTFKSQVQKRDFWVLPGYYLGISLKGATLSDLVKSRTTTTLTILILLVCVFGAGILFLYRNISREIQLSQSKSEFVSNVSHEIRTPLSLIGMFAETLENGRVMSEEKKKEYYSIISKETSRLSRIVNRILNFSQLEASKKRFTFEPIQLNDLYSEIQETYFHHLKDKGFALKFEPSEDLGLIQGDREAISEAIINLLDNAIKYSHDKKHITVKTGRDFNFRYIDVTDLGIGIPKKHHSEIFEQFFRAPTGDVHTTKGSGLGLTLVKKIMEAHHGQVTVVSSPGKGSTFRLKFPVLKEETHAI